MQDSNGKAPRLGAVVITYNEESNIGRCLDSLKFCEEIVVVDSQSSDATREIARQYTPHVHERPWKGYVAQRNEAVALSSCDWILSVDADEVVTPELREEIERVLANPREYTAFSVPRRTIHMGRWIRHGGWYPNRLVRLFRRDAGSWVGSEVHEYWNTAGPVGSLRQDLLHYSFRNLADQVQRNNLYSSLGAQSLRKAGHRFSSFMLLYKSLSKFLETYVLKRGFLDGYPGFIISVSAAYSVFLKWAKLWELERGEKTVG